MTDEFFLPLVGNEAIWVVPRDPASGRLSAYQWETTTQNIADLSSPVNVFSYLPVPLQLQVSARTCTTDLSVYLNQAHAAAGVKGHVHYPAGTYPCFNITYYDSQSITGDGSTTSILTKAGLASANANSILVSYNWLNDITTQEAGLNIEGLGFVADSASTNGYGMVVMARRPRIINCAVTGDPAGPFGGLHVTTNTISRLPITNNNNLAGSLVTGNNWTHLLKGAVVGHATFITSIVNNVSITLSRTTVGPGGTFTGYQDANTNQNFTGTSNGTNVIQVANTSNLFVGDQVRFNDIYNDLITDFYLTGKNTFGDCGSTDQTQAGTIFTVDSPNMNGWQIVGNKFNVGQGGHINCTGNCHSIVIADNLLDYGPTNPIISGTNYCIQLQIDQGGLINIIGNQFKGRSISDVTKTYRMLDVSPSYTTQISTDNIVMANSFDMPVNPTDFKAFVVHSPNIVGGASENVYNYTMTQAQRGNGESAWSTAEPVPLLVGITAHAGGGQGSATPLNYGFNEVQVCATNGDSVLLPAATGTGISVEVGNSGAASCNVFPAGTDAINRGSASSAKAVASGAGATFTDIATGQWRSIP